MLNSLGGSDGVTELKLKGKPMPKGFLSNTTPVVVSSFAWTEDGQPIDGRIYYLIKLESENRFLRQAYRPLWEKSWTAKLAKAVLFNTPKSAMDFATQHFMNVKEDYE